MKRWSSDADGHVEDPKVDAFVAELIEVCKRHKMTLAHEDTHGAFLVRHGFDGGEWLASAAIAQRGACVCTYAVACSPQCPCAYPSMSGGCERCDMYRARNVIPSG